MQQHTDTGSVAQIVNLALQAADEPGQHVTHSGAGHARVACIAQGGKIVCAIGYDNSDKDIKRRRRMDKALPNARKAIEELAKRHELKIVCWYEDLGISGDETSKRPQFRQMNG